MTTPQFEMSTSGITKMLEHAKSDGESPVAITSKFVQKLLHPHCQLTALQADIIDKLPLPKIEVLPDFLVKVISGSATCEGFYQAGNDLIVVSEKFHIEIIVHELVHFYQDKSGLLPDDDRCFEFKTKQRELERQAYRTQIKFMLHALCKDGNSDDLERMHFAMQETNLSFDKRYPKTSLSFRPLFSEDELTKVKTALTAEQKHNAIDLSEKMVL